MGWGGVRTATRSDQTSWQLRPALPVQSVPQVVQRARQQDLNSLVRYQVAFLRNLRGEVVPDRSFNTGGDQECSVCVCSCVLIWSRSATGLSTLDVRLQPAPGVLRVAGGVAGPCVAMRH